MKKDKDLGQVYTPDYIVYQILEDLKYKGNSILKKYILEPACGDGNFLLEIVKRYIIAGRDKNLTDNEIIKDLETYIYAFELDNDEYKKVLNNLDKLVVDYNFKQKVNWKIFNTNTFLEYKKYSIFFDYIIGNPPYIRIHNINNTTKTLIKNNKFQFDNGTIDIYLFFFEMGFFMLKDQGYLGYITPNSFLHNTSYKDFREYIKEKKELISLTDFKSHKIFTGYSTYTAISIFHKGNKKNSFLYKELNNNIKTDGKNKDTDSTILNNIVVQNTILYNNTSSRDWSFTNKENEEFLKNLPIHKNIKFLEKNKIEITDLEKISKFFNVGYGLATLRDKIFIGEIKESTFQDELVYFNECLIERELLKTIVKGSKYKGITNHTIKIIFPYYYNKEINKYCIIEEEELKSNYPYTYSYLLNNKKELLSRDIKKNTLWYEYGRSQGIQLMNKEKIVISTLVDNLGTVPFYKVGDDIFIYSGIFITLKEEFKKDKEIWNIIIELLSSDDFYKYVRLTGKDFSGGYKGITPKMIKNFLVKVDKKKKK